MRAQTIGFVRPETLVRVGDSHVLTKSLNLFFKVVEAQTLALVFSLTPAYSRLLSSVSCALSKKWFVLVLPVLPQLWG